MVVLNFSPAQKVEPRTMAVGNEYASAGARSNPDAPRVVPTSQDPSANLFSSNRRIADIGSLVLVTVPDFGYAFTYLKLPVNE